MSTLYATKCWQEDVHIVASRHPNAQLIVGNNLGERFLDIGQTDQPYFQPEMEAVKQAAKLDYRYILWYASDVIPPEHDWVPEAIKLLSRYPIVAPFFEQNYEDYVRAYKPRQTKFGFSDQHFSDQAYFAEVETMLNIDYNLTHPIKWDYPRHGGNSFERRVAQWLAVTGKRRAVLKDFQYRHIPRSEK